MFWPLVMATTKTAENAFLASVNHWLFLYSDHNETQVEKVATWQRVNTINFECCFERHGRDSGSWLYFCLFLLLPICPDFIQGSLGLWLHKLPAFDKISSKRRVSMSLDIQVLQEFCGCHWTQFPSMLACTTSLNKLVGAASFTLRAIE